MESLPVVVKAEHVDGFRLRVAFADGTKGTVDFQDWLDGPIFERLKEPSYFTRFYVDAGTVVWPNGADIAHSMASGICVKLLGEAEG